MTKHQSAQDFGLFVLRVALGLYLLLAGVGKVQGEINNGIGSFYKGAGFQGLQPDWLPDVLAAPYGYALPWLEVIIGGMLIVGLLGHLAALLGLLMLVSFTLAKVMASGDIAATGPSDPGAFSTNYIQIAGYLMLTLVGCGRWAVDTKLLGKRKGKG